MTLIIALCQIGVLAILTFQGPTSTSLTDLKRDQLRGPVRTLRVELATAIRKDGRLVELSRRVHQTVTYNEQGYEVERVNFEEDGTITDRSIREVDPSGREISWHEHERSADGKLVVSPSSGHWIYDDLGRAIEFYVSNGTAKELVVTYEYDNLSRKAKETRITDGGSSRETTAYRYDSLGRLTETSCDSNGHRSRMIQEYGERGRLIRYKSISDAGSGDGEATYAYNPDGLEIERRSETELAWTRVVTSYDSHMRVTQRETWIGYKLPDISISHMPEPGRITYSYDEKGMVINETAYSPDGKVRTTTTTTYSSGGRPVHIRTLDGGGVIRSDIEYEYDSNGNVIRTVTSSADSDGESELYVEDRILTYYGSD